MTSLDFQSLLNQEKALQRAQLAQSTRTTVVQQEEESGPTSSSRLSTRRRDEERKVVGTKEPTPLFVKLAGRPSLDMKKMRVGNTPSIFYVPDFISGADEQQLFERIHAQASGNEWVTLRSRRLKCWGGQPGESFRPEPLPPWVDALCESLVVRGVFSEETRPNHVLLNEYQPGQGIMAHTDGPFYEPRTATLSLGSDAVMHFSPRIETSRIGRPGVETRPQASLVLRSLSLVVFADDAYSRLMHSIDAVREETVGCGGSSGDVDERGAGGGRGGAPVINNAAAGAPKGTILRRKLRVSLTFRRVRAADRGEETGGSEPAKNAAELLV
ncbi:unnamed protein product [Ectocarpus sp. 4 AP-2014]